MITGIYFLSAIDQLPADISPEFNMLIFNK